MTPFSVRRIAANTGYQVVTFISIALSNAVLVVAVARIHGPDALGTFSFVVTCVLLASVLGDLGIGTLLTREISRLRECEQAVAKLAGNGLSVGVVLGMLVATTTFLAAPLIGVSQEVAIGIQIVAPGICLAAVSSILRGLFHAHERMEYESVFVSAQEFVYLVAGTVTLLSTLPLVWVFASYSLSRVLGLVVALTTYRRRIGRIRLRFDWSTWAVLSTKGLPFAANSVLAVVHLRAAIVLLGILSGGAAMGFYEAGGVLALRINVFARMVSNSMLPTLADCYPDEMERLGRVLALMVRYAILAGIPAVIILATLSRPIVIMLYGDKFVEAASVFAILAAITPVRFASNVLATGLTATDAQGDRTMGVLVAALLSIVIGFALIPAHQHIGAAASTALVELVLFALFLRFISRRLNVSAVFAAHLKPIAAGLGLTTLALILMSLTLPGWLSVSISLPLYCLVAWRWFLTSDDRSYVRLLLAK